MNTEELNELYLECIESVDNEFAAIQKFLLLAKQKEDSITMDTVKQITGFVHAPSEDEKEEEAAKTQNNLDQKWKNNILSPVRSFIAKEVLKLQDDPAVIFGRKATDEQKELRSKINEYIPLRTRKTVAAVNNFDHLKGIFS